MGRCIFCGETKQLFNSIEHIIPESLGNHEFFLDKGYVCDKCNNYFASHIEKQFLEIESIKLIRILHNVKNKKLRPTRTSCFIAGHNATIYQDNGKIFIEVEEPDEIYDIIKKNPKVFITKAITVADLENSQTVSRMLGKIALEYYVYLFIKANEGEEIEVEISPESKELVNFVRQGGKSFIWPYRVQEINDVTGYSDQDKRYSYIRLSLQNENNHIKFTMILYKTMFNMYMDTSQRFE